MIGWFCVLGFLFFGFFFIGYFKRSRRGLVCGFNVFFIIELGKMGVGINFFIYRFWYSFEFNF